MPLPRFSTMMAKVTVSPASTLRRLLSTGIAARFVLSIVPVKRTPEEPGAEKVTGPTTPGLKAPFGLSVATMPLVMRSSGSVRVSWRMATASPTTWPDSSSSRACAWLVRCSPSPKGWSMTLTVKSRSTVVAWAETGCRSRNSIEKLLLSAWTTMSGTCDSSARKAAASGPHFTTFSGGGSPLMVSSGVSTKVETSKIGSGR